MKSYKKFIANKTNDFFRVSLKAKLLYSNVINDLWVFKTMPRLEHQRSKMVIITWLVNIVSGFFKQTYLSLLILFYCLYFTFIKKKQLTARSAWTSIICLYVHQRNPMYIGFLTWYGQGPVSVKSRKLFGPEKPFVKLRPAYSVKMVFSYVVKEIKSK